MNHVANDLARKKALRVFEGFLELRNVCSILKHLKASRCVARFLLTGQKPWSLPLIVVFSA